jgi:hypothetical protein
VLVYSGVRKHIKRVVGSRVGQLLAVLGLCFALLELVHLPAYHPQFVSCVPTREEVYTITEILAPKPAWVVAIGVLYIPSVLLTSALTQVLRYMFGLSCTPTARLEFVGFLVCGSIQWLLVGYGIEWLIKRRAS